MFWPIDLETNGGYQLEVMTYGATILRYVTPDKAGNFANVILGLMTLIAM